jgi:ribosomal-protein-alanine N-acetyltransferase
VDQLTCLPAAIIDIPAIVDLDQRSLGGLWSADGYRRELDSPNSCLLVLSRAPRDSTEQSAKASQSSPDLLGIGCYWAIVDEAHITLLGIDPRYQRRGLGQWLLLRLLQDACGRSLNRATLEVRATNTRALALYGKFGFEPLGNRRRYYPDGEDALILWQNSLSQPGFRTHLTNLSHQVVTRLQSQGWQINPTELSVNRT